MELDEAELQQMILDRGAVPAQDLTLTRTCTVVGIVETVSDRWDVGDTALPNCYLSEATAGELRDTLSYLETKDAPRLYRLPEEQKLLFLRGSGTVAGLYGQVLETELPRVREISENQYYRLLDNEWGLAGYGHEATEWDLNLAREQWAEEQAEGPVPGRNFPGGFGGGFQPVWRGLDGKGESPGQLLSKGGLLPCARLPVGDE
ncbi:MAG: hypothetical protein ACLSHU_06615 [Oscillospiraceae bacterium]